MDCLIEARTLPHHMRHTIQLRGCSTNVITAYRNDHDSSPLHGTYRSVRKYGHNAGPSSARRRFQLGCDVGCFHWIEASKLRKAPIAILKHCCSPDPLIKERLLDKTAELCNFHKLLLELWRQRLVLIR